MSSKAEIVVKRFERTTRRNGLGSSLAYLRAEKGRVYRDVYYAVSDVLKDVLRKEGIETNTRDSKNDILTFVITSNSRISIKATRACLENIDNVIEKLNQNAARRKEAYESRISQASETNNNDDANSSEAELESQNIIDGEQSSVVSSQDEVQIEGGI